MPSVWAERVRQEIQHSSRLASQKLVRMRNSIFLGVQVLSRHLVTSGDRLGISCLSCQLFSPLSLTGCLHPALGCCTCQAHFLQCLASLQRCQSHPPEKGTGERFLFCPTPQTWPQENNPSGRNYRSREVCHANMSKAAFSL